MKKWKRMVSLITTAAVLSGMLTACGRRDIMEGVTPTVEPTDDIWAAYDETVTLTTVLAEDTAITFYEGEDWTKNAWYDAYLDRFNIQVENLWISNDYNTKLNLAIADGDLPDVFKVSASQLQQLAEAGLIYDLTELLDVYGSDTLKSYYEYDPDTFETGKFDGKLFGLPQMTYGIIDQFQYVWIRKDWKEKLKLPDPETMEDVIAIAQAFKDEYGGYGLSECQNLDMFNRFALAYDAHWDVWIKTENGIESGKIQPEMKEAIAAYKDLYEQGLMNPNFTTTTWDAMNEGLINSKSGIVLGPHWLSYSFIPDVISNNGAEAIFEPYAIPSVTGGIALGSVTNGNRGYIVINKKCEHPEAAMKLINYYSYLMDDAAGKEDPDFIMKLFNNSYATGIPYGLCVINPLTDYNQFIQVKEAVEKYKAGESVDTTELGKNVSKYDSCVKWLEDQDVTGVGDFLQQGNEKSTYGLAKEFVDNEHYIKDALWGANPDSLNAMGGTLDDILREGFTKIIIGEKDIDYFDALVEKWKSAGGDLVTEEINEMYGNQEGE